MSETSSRLVIVRDGQALMTRGDSGSVKFVGGRMRLGEDPMKAAIREALEEIGVNLDIMGEEVFPLPFQGSDPDRPSHWHGLVLDTLANFEPKPGDDVVELFWVALQLVESELTYQDWKNHWTNCLLPGLVARGRG